MALRLLHLSDLHFGRPSILAQIEEVENILDREPFSAIVISGDVTQRARPGQFDRARAFIETAEQRAPVLIVPGNHDTAWWMAPMGIGTGEKMYARYRRFIRQNLEPVLHVPGATIVGLNSAHGIQPYTLTMRPRDLSVVGAIRAAQWEHAKTEFAAAPADDLKVLVFHHNLLRGDLSNRWGLANRAAGIASALGTGAELVLCGHDHDEKVDQIMVGARKMVVACASTLTNRVRGGGPSSINVIDADATTITVNDWEWSDKIGTFSRAKWARYTRESRDRRGSMSETPEIIDNPDANRFEIHADGATAFLTYRMKGGAMEYLHSETPAELRGRGYAGDLAKFALDRDRIAGRTVIPTCPFVKSYIEKHPEYAPLVLAK